MKIKLVDTQENKFVIVDQEDKGHLAFWWFEGNMGCESNRAGYFDNEDDDHECEHICEPSRYLIESIECGGKVFEFDERAIQQDSCNESFWDTYGALREMLDNIEEQSKR